VPPIWRARTRGKAASTYGFIEVRAKMPCGRGTWPAIWMLGTGGRWPFDRPQYLILNLAIGGVLGGAVDPAFTTQQMEVDHVRAYRR
jgi:beta-glucanase (GH16 family)